MPNTEKKRTVVIVVSQQGVESIYDDDFDFKVFGEPVIRRASNINPVLPPAWWEYLLACVYWPLFGQLRQRRKCRGKFCIQWAGQMKRLLGGPVFTTETGQPFHTKREAEAYEVYLLRRDYFRIVC